MFPREEFIANGLAVGQVPAGGLEWVQSRMLAVEAAVSSCFSDSIDDHQWGSVGPYLDQATDLQLLRLATTFLGMRSEAHWRNPASVYLRLNGVIKDFQLTIESYLKPEDKRFWEWFDHDIAVVITEGMGYGSWLKSEELTGEVKQCVGKLRYCERFLEMVLIDSVRDRLALGGNGQFRERVLLGEYMDDVLSVYAAHFPKIEFAGLQGPIVADPLCQVKIDRYAMERVFFNVFKNADRYCECPDGGTKRITFMYLPLVASPWDGKASSLLLLADNGKGMGEDMQEGYFIEGVTTSGSGMGGAIIFDRCRRSGVKVQVFNGDDLSWVPGVGKRKFGLVHAFWMPHA